MPAFNSIPIDKLARLIGTARCPAIIDIRTDAEFAAFPRTVPGAKRRSLAATADWAPDFAGAATVVLCEDGGTAGQGVAAWLRQAGASAEIVEGGAASWRKAGLPTVDEAAVPPRDLMGRTLWVTRARPKIDRIACPWLIRRFVDSAAMF
ncbi:MAG: sulfurtransferase, partial [Sphingomonas bacterium]|uniref:chromate resistance protein ChrB domain-containing protein n=1 Tax=Sphingomonas bacterium TaxID=1895847 RepID=UPI00262C6FDC